MLAIECRFVRQQPLDAPVTTFLEAISGGFTDIRGVDGSLRWSERVEGSASYLRLIHEIPPSLRVPGL
jgi:hypothetical protein